TVAVPSSNAERLTKELMERGIVTSHREGNIRAAFHFYNNDEDIATFIDAMTDLRASLRR
ncbi:MAG: aminotransferase class V-fold PLP-dependent enzyme, partial [Rhizomicrobium sp.]